MVVVQLGLMLSKQRDMCWRAVHSSVEPKSEEASTWARSTNSMIAKRE